MTVEKPGHFRTILTVQAICHWVHSHIIVVASAEKRDWWRFLIEEDVDIPLPSWESRTTPARAKTGPFGTTLGPNASVFLGLCAVEILRRLCQQLGLGSEPHRVLKL